MIDIFSVQGLSCSFEKNGWLISIPSVDGKVADRILCKKDYAARGTAVNFSVFTQGHSLFASGISDTKPTELRKFYGHSLRYFFEAIVLNTEILDDVEAMLKK